MSKFWSGSVAGVTLQNSGALSYRLSVEGAGRFLPTTRATFQAAADGTPHFQFGTTNTKGQSFTLTAEYMESSVLTSVMSAINTAMASGTTFVVNITNGAQTINKNCILLGAGPEVGSEASSSIVKLVRFTFISQN